MVALLAMAARTGFAQGEVLFPLTELESIRSTLELQPRPSYEILGVLPPGQTPAHINDWSIRAQQIDVRVRSWLFLMDASKDNPLASTELKAYREKNPECATRILLEIIEQGLAQVSEPMGRMSILYTLFGWPNSSFDIAKWVSMESMTVQELNTRFMLQDPLAKFYGSLVGTESFEFARGILDSDQGVRVPGSRHHVSRFLKQSVQELKLLTDPIRYRQVLDTAMRCKTPLDGRKQFAWVDLQAIQDLSASQADAKTLQERLIMLFDSTWIPEIRSKHSEFPVINASAFALRPSLGILHRQVLSESFIRAYWKAFAASAFDSRGYVTAEGCKRAERAAIFGTLVGLEAAGPDEATDLHVSAENFREWARLGAALWIAAGLESLSSHCIHAVSAFSRLMGDRFQSLSELGKVVMERGPRAVNGESMTLVVPSHADWKVTLKFSGNDKKRAKIPQIAPLDEKKVAEIERQSKVSTNPWVREELGAGRKVWEGTKEVVQDSLFYQILSGRILRPASW